MPKASYLRVALATLVSTLILTGCSGGDAPQASTGPEQPTAAGTPPGASDNTAADAAMTEEEAQTVFTLQVATLRAAWFDVEHDDRTAFCESIQKSYGTGLADRFTEQFPGVLSGDVDLSVYFEFRNTNCADHLTEVAEAKAADEAEAAAQPLGFAVTCYEDTGDHNNETGEEFDSIEEAWSYDARFCEVSDTTGGTLTDIQSEALAVAGIDEDDLGGLYTMCAAVNHLYTDPHPNAHTDGVTLEDADRISGALVLCPDHPNADALRNTVAAAEQNAVADEEREAGLRLEDGTYIVGEEIEPGTWVVDRSRSGCYWERTDATGETIDNNFISGRTRVEVTIRPSDYSFHSQRCGEWRKVD